MNFRFWFLQELLMVWEAISNTQKSVSSDFQKPQSWFKKLGCTSGFFQLTSQCLEIGCNTLNRVGHTDLKFLTAWTNLLITRKKVFIYWPFFLVECFQVLRLKWLWNLMIYPRMSFQTVLYYSEKDSSQSTLPVGNQVICCFPASGFGFHQVRFRLTKTWGKRRILVELNSSNLLILK